MSYREVVEEVKRWPFHEQLRLIEDLARSMQKQLTPSQEAPETTAPMSPLHSAFKPAEETSPLVGAFPLTDDWLDDAKNEGRA